MQLNQARNRRWSLSWACGDRPISSARGITANLIVKLLFDCDDSVGEVTAKAKKYYLTKTDSSNVVV
jgi:hypothetical protein